jgi:hypothetical protein
MFYLRLVKLSQFNLFCSVELRLQLRNAYECPLHDTRTRANGCVERNGTVYSTQYAALRRHHSVY